MAGKARFSIPATYRFFSTDNPDPQPLEIDESEIWNSTPSSLDRRPESKKPVRRIAKKSVKRSAVSDDRPAAAAASSLPVNIPDWSKILPTGCRGSGRQETGGESAEEEEDWIPPHEFLAKQFARARIASFSLHEGRGRTLKGRDLSRVRDAIWEKTGFEA